MWRRWIRLLAFGHRFFITCENFGFGNACKLYWGLYTSDRLQRVFHKALKRFIYFRGRADLGVMSHFWKPLFRIQSDHPLQTIIDVGANIGDETIRFRHFHPDALLIAIEAEAENFKVLQKNFENDPKTILYQRALWYKPTVLFLAQTSSSNESFRVQAGSVTSSSPATVQTITLKQLMREHGLSHIDILKMDIEGAEKAIFSFHTEAWLDKVDVLIFEIPDNDNPGATQLIFEKLAGLPFDVHSCGECLVLIKRDRGLSMERVVYYSIPSSVKRADSMVNPS